MSTSARKENRWKRTVQQSNDAISDRAREIEALHMVRGPRRVSVPPKPSATRKQVRSWMRMNASEYDNPTQLAEGANVVFDLPCGAMDDETHWVWDEALDAIEYSEREH